MWGAPANTVETPATLGTVPMTETPTLGSRGLTGSAQKYLEHGGLQPGPPVRAPGPLPPADAPSGLERLLEIAGMCTSISKSLKTAEL